MGTVTAWSKPGDCPTHAPSVSTSTPDPICSDPLSRTAVLILGFGTGIQNLNWNQRPDIDIKRIFVCFCGAIFFYRTYGDSYCSDMYSYLNLDWNPDSKDKKNYWISHLVRVAI